MSAGNAAGSNTVDYLVVAGGGGGGNLDGGGGGGAGGLENLQAADCYTASFRSSAALPVQLQVIQLQ